MDNSQNQDKAPRWWNDRTLFFYHFARSNYVSGLWNWFLGLAGKAAEPFLCASVLYSGAKLLPGVHTTPGWDAFMFIGQQLALDIGGMSLTKLAQQARHDGETEIATTARRVGFTLIGLMIANVVLSSSQRSFNIPENVVQVIEALLLIARAVMAVIYGYVIYSMHKEEMDQSSMVKSSDVYTHLNDFGTTVNQVAQQIQLVQENIPQVVHSVVQAHINTIVSEIHEAVQSELIGVVHQIPETVQKEVQFLVAEQVQPLIEGQVQAMVQVLEEGNNTTALQELAERLQEVSASVHQMHTTITEVRTVRQVSHASEPSPRATRGSTKVIENEPSKVVQSSQSRVRAELPERTYSEPAEIRVSRYISEQLTQGHVPSLTEIEKYCDVSRNTAIRYRRDALGVQKEDKEENENNTVIHN
ncbi:hypothetical protein [Dictyobacter formicarum]|uniref:Uncharacterized protein n=1 Tax=Dictyobacter formicarum TaxID=2778368 RepID=A0ABQ3VQA7_9CHLR|nr:hypothetical protein [Dictyobacter formicarum]GHO88042.1 hypothetical protein KSZ_60480 [Dictyobacter formicarum]